MAVLLLVALGVMGLTGCEPAMTITAKIAPPPSPITPVCLNDPEIIGTVTPPDATKKVVLQRSSGGKWTDFKWYTTLDSSAEPELLTSGVNPYDGGYAIQVQRYYIGAKLRGVQSFRVRSAGSSAVSPKVYINFDACIS